MSYSKTQHDVLNGRSNLGPLDFVSDTLPQAQLAPNDQMNLYACETVCRMTCNSSLKLAFTECVEKQSKLFNYYPL